MATASIVTRSLLDIIRAEFNEMPDMHLTRAQLRRLWALSDEQSHDVVEELLRCGFLVRGRQDRFRRRDA